MKQNIVLLFALLLAFALVTSVSAQDDKANRPSPPAQASGTIDGTSITIDYSQPSVKGRTIFGDLEPYGKVWRTGANEATTIEVDADVLIEGQPLARGKYALFTIPRENDDWTVIFNKVANQWGAFKYDESQDALRVPVAPRKTATATEKLTFEVTDSEVQWKWATTEVAFGVASAGEASK